MALCVLPNSLIESDRLPMLCMLCGKPATLQLVREFNSFPRWIYILLPGYVPFLIAYLITRQTKYLRVRFCDEHRHHYYLRSITVPLGVFIILMAIFANANYVTTDGWQTLGWVVIGIGSLLWIALLIYQRFTSIHPIEITPNYITMVNVHEDYATAVQQTVDNELERLLRQ